MFDDLVWSGGSGVLSCAGHQRFDPVHIQLVDALVRLQFSSLLHVLDRRVILFLLGMNPRAVPVRNVIPGAVPVSNIVLGIEFDGAIEVSDSPIEIFFFIFGVAAPAISLAIFRVAPDIIRKIPDQLVVVGKEELR